MNQISDIHALGLCFLEVLQYLMMKCCIRNERTANLFPFSIGTVAEATLTTKKWKRTPHH